MIALALILQAVSLPAGKTLILGEGLSSCAAAMNGSKKERAVWIMGFWSGLNAATGRTVGSTSDADGIVGEVERRCVLEPTAPLVMVTAAAFEDLTQKER